jgi:thymidylate synthase (FAD)
MSIEVTYKAHMGSDDFVCDMARVSFDKVSSNFTTEQNNKLLAYLAKHNHWSPFAHPQVTLHVKCPIFVARQDFKHVVGFARNEVSRRYVDDAPEFFTPDTWRSRPEGSIKQGSGEALSTDQGFGGSLGSPYEMAAYAYQHAVNTCAQSYDNLLKAGVAPEQARMVLPQSMYTSYYVTGSLSAWARAYKQRIDSHAQVEIQDLAKQWDEVIAPLFPESWEVLTR